MPISLLIARALVGVPLTGAGNGQRLLQQRPAAAVRRSKGAISRVVRQGLKLLSQRGQIGGGRRRTVAHGGVSSSGDGSPSHRLGE